MPLPLSVVRYFLPLEMPSERLPALCFVDQFLLFPQLFLLLGLHLLQLLLTEFCLLLVCLLHLPDFLQLLQVFLQVARAYGLVVKVLFVMLIVFVAWLGHVDLSWGFMCCWGLLDLWILVVSGDNWFWVWVSVFYWYVRSRLEFDIMLIWRIIVFYGLEVFFVVIALSILAYWFCLVHFVVRIFPYRQVRHILWRLALLWLALLCLVIFNRLEVFFVVIALSILAYWLCLVHFVVRIFPYWYILYIFCFFLS